MSRQVVFAVVAAAVVSGVMHFALAPFRPGGQSEAKVDAFEKRVREMDDRTETLLRRLDRIETAAARERRTGGGTPGGEDSAAESAGPGTTVLPTDESGRPLAPDGTPYLSRADVERMIEERAASLAETPFVPKPPQTLEDAAREMGLSADEEASLRIILRESEEEVITSLFGERPLEDIKLEIAAVRDDPEGMQRLMQGVVARGFSNAGKLLTLEGRTRRRMENLLGKERAADFRSRNVKPVHGEEFEKILEEAF